MLIVSHTVTLIVYLAIGGGIWLFALNGVEKALIPIRRWIGNWQENLKHDRFAGKVMRWMGEDEQDWEDFREFCDGIQDKRRARV
jgi:hypothetical protein